MLAFLNQVFIFLSAGGRAIPRDRTPFNALAAMSKKAMLPAIIVQSGRVRDGSRAMQFSKCSSKQLQKINLVANNLTWEQLLWSVAEQHDLGVCNLDGLYYVGPQKTCESLPHLYDQIQKQLLKNRRQLKVNWMARSELPLPKLGQLQPLP